MINPFIDLGGQAIYAKLGVSSRAAATLYATQHSLMGTFESAG